MRCKKCKKWETCTELCPEIRRLLERKPEGRKYSDRNIRRYEVPYDPALFEEFLPNEFIDRMRGWKRHSGL